MLYTKEKQELIDEIRYTLPTKRILDIVSNAAVTNPYNGEVYFLKNRQHDLNIPTEDFHLYSKKRHYLDDYSDILKKDIMIHPSILHPRAREAFEKLSIL